nr:hypothetical protein [Chromobacterium sp. ASV5]
MKKSVIAIAVLAAAFGADLALAAGGPYVATTDAYVQVDGVKAPQDYGISANAYERVQLVYNSTTEKFDVQNGGKTPISIDVKNPAHSTPGTAFSDFRLEVALSSDGKVKKVGDTTQGVVMNFGVGDQTLAPGAGFKTIALDSLEGTESLDPLADKGTGSAVTSITPMVASAFKSGGPADYKDLDAGNYTGQMGFKIRATWTE